MREKLLLSLFCFLVFWGLSCSGNSAYTPPKTSVTPKNSITVDKSKEEVWKEIVPALGKTFFVINNLDKESGFINISYSGDPEKYVDCGKIHSYVSNLAGTRTYDFPASKAYQQYEELNNAGLFSIVRTMELEGRMNIIIEELETNKTRVTVNTKYILTRKADITNPQGTQSRLNDTVNFNSGQQVNFPQGTVCQCNGNFEEEVLSLLLGSESPNKSVNTTKENTTFQATIDPKTGNPVVTPVNKDN